MKKLYKSNQSRILTGVIGGVGEFFDIDPTVLRILWILVTIFTGVVPGIIVYILAVFIVPDSPREPRKR